MADEVDLASERIERETEARLKSGYELPEGKPGNCDLCGEWSGRLIDGACAPCRERYQLD